MKSVARIGVLLAALCVTAAVFAVAGRADDPRFDQIDSTLAPGIVDAGATVLYKTQWHYIDNQTLTHPIVQIMVPSGWTLVEADPAVCTQDTGSTTISCPRGTVRTNDLVAQSVELRNDGVLGEKTVSSALIFYEGPRNPGRLNRVLSDDVTTTEVISASDTVEPDRAGACADASGATISTARGNGNSATSATVPATDELCTPISIKERGRTSPEDACLSGFVCQTDVVTTDAADVGTSTPIILTMTFYGQGLNTNLPLIFISNDASGRVPDCTGDGATPDPCIQSSRSRQQSLTRVVRWSGLDPTWTD